AIAAVERELPTLQRTLVLPYLAGGDWELPPAELEFAQLPFDHPLWVLYSSGTTGLPKAIVHGQGGILLEHLKKLRLHLEGQAAISRASTASGRPDRRSPPRASTGCATGSARMSGSSPPPAAPTSARPSSAESPRSRSTAGSCRRERSARRSRRGARTGAHW